MQQWGWIKRRSLPLIREGEQLIWHKGREVNSKAKKELRKVLQRGSCLNCAPQLLSRSSSHRIVSIHLAAMKPESTNKSYLSVWYRAILYVPLPLMQATKKISINLKKI